jgi:hypothetical protein
MGYILALCPVIFDAVTFVRTGRSSGNWLVARNNAIWGVYTNLVGGLLAIVGTASPQFIGALNDIPGYRDGALVATFVVSGCATLIGSVAGIARTLPWAHGPVVTASVDAAINLILAGSNFAAGIVYVNRSVSAAELPGRRESLVFQPAQ